MPPKTLTIFPNFPNLHPKLQNPTSKFHIPYKTHFSKLKIIKCKANSDPITHETTQNIRVSKPETETETVGTGPSAPTRGEVFLEYHQAKAASKIVLSANKKKRKKKNDELLSGSVKVMNLVASCYGCGAPLQTNEADAPGFVDLDTFELKKKHHQLRTVICGRCKLLSHGHMITAVGGHGGYAGGKQFVTAEQLRDKLSHLRHEKALIVKLVDIVDFSGSFLNRVRDLSGANPIILVVTKVDLLPKGTDMNCIGDWVVEATTKKKLNVISVHLTSSKSLVGITGVVAEIQKEKKGRDVYILGTANVGKSAFINAVLRLMADKDPVAAAAQKYKPIQSAVPGTTLGPIQIDAFFGGGKLYDTPGVHLHHRQAAVVHTDDLPALAPQSRLKGRSFPGSNQSSEEVISLANGLEGFSIFWGGLVRVDALKVLPCTRLTFYGPKALQLHVVPTKEADEFYKKEIGVLLTPPKGKLRAESWNGLESHRMLQLRFDEIEGPLCDVAISGLGWITIEPISKELVKTSTPTPIPELPIDELHFKVHVPKPVEVFIRSPLPIGKAGSEWYQYRDITELEEETRPKWHY